MADEEQSGSPNEPLPALLELHEPSACGLRLLMDFTGCFFTRLDFRAGFSAASSELFIKNNLSSETSGVNCNVMKQFIYAPAFYRHF